MIKIDEVVDEETDLQLGEDEMRYWTEVVNKLYKMVSTTERVDAPVQTNSILERLEDKHVREELRDKEISRTPYIPLGSRRKCSHTWIDYKQAQ